MSQVDNEHLRYFVDNGVMCSGRMLGHVTFEANCANYEYASTICEAILKTDILPSHIPANGVYVLLTGMKVMREKDLFKTKEEAAENFRNKLLM